MKSVGRADGHPLECPAPLASATWCANIYSELILHQQEQVGDFNMKKNDIIMRTLVDFWNEPREDGDSPLEEVDPENPVVVALVAALKSADPDADIRTCEDFYHLHVECCDTCHRSYPHYDMALIDLESGGNAWICCAIEQALNPGKYPKLAQLPQCVDLEILLGHYEPDVGR
jgi:hypothetical protein